MSICVTPFDVRRLSFTFRCYLLFVTTPGVFGFSFGRGFTTGRGTQRRIFHFISFLHTLYSARICMGRGWPSVDVSVDA